MKKILSLLLLMGLLGTPFALAADERPYVSVNTKAEEEFAPNVANVRFYIETQDKDLKVATDKNKEQTQKALEAVKKLLDTKAGDMVQTVNFSAYPEYSYKNNTKTFLHYSVSNGFQVRLKNTDNLGKVISEGLKNGATRVGDLNFSLDNTQNACNELIKKAVASSKTRAQQTAVAAGSSVLGIKSINASCSGDNSYYPQFRMTNSAKLSSGAMDAAESSVPTELGTIKMYANVNANYFVK